jgi:hypothetical protein
MVFFLRPFFRFRKYLVANRLLKAATSKVAVSNINDIKMYEPQFVPYQLKFYFQLHSKAKPERVVEAADILVKNGHVTKEDNKDYYRIVITCTKEGERAYNDGYYAIKIYISVTYSIGLIAGIVMLLLKGKAILQLIRGLLCMALLYRDIL